MPRKNIKQAKIVMMPKAAIFLIAGRVREDDYI